MKFYLLWNPTTNRLVIDKTSDLPGYEVQKQTTASCWIDAKRKFGFELTSLQQDILNGKDNSIETRRRTLEYSENAREKLRSADCKLPDWIKDGFDSELGVQ